MQAVILAAGEGKRVRPFTRSRPKALIPVANRPIIEYTIQALLANGVREIIVVVGYRKEQVIRYLNQPRCFDRGGGAGASARYRPCPQMRRTA